MAELNRFTPFFFFLSGTANVLLIKWCDRMESEGIDGVNRNFQHPFIQTGCMFFGQFLCFLFYELVFKLLRRRQDGSEDTNPLTVGNEDYSPRIFVVPAICDLIASAMLFTGLYFTNVSSFMMLRCAVMIFIGIFGVIYLNQTLKCLQWIGILVVAIGAILITIRDYDDHHFRSLKSALTGDLLILCSLVFHGLKHVHEEKYVKVLDIPSLRAVGWQGIFGLLIMTVLYIPLNFMKAGNPFNNNAHGVVEDFLDAMAQLANNYLIVLALGLFVISVAIYNYCGIRITKHASSDLRSSFNTTIALTTWSFSAIFEWERWMFEKFVLFAVIVIGGWIYRNRVFVPIYRRGMSAYSRRRNGNLPSEEVTSQPADVI